MLLGLYGFGFAFAAIVLLMREANTLVDVSSFLRTGTFRDELPCTVAALLVDSSCDDAATHLRLGCGTWNSIENKHASTHQCGSHPVDRFHGRDAVVRRLVLLQS